MLLFELSSSSASTILKNLKKQKKTKKKIKHDLKWNNYSEFVYVSMLQ